MLAYDCLTEEAADKLVKDLKAKGIKAKKEPWYGDWRVVYHDPSVEF